MKKTLLALLLLILAQHGNSQVNYSQDAGTVTQYEMSMTEYEGDKDAEALVIYELGDYYFQANDLQGFVLYMNVRTKIKILKQAGVKYATFEIPYYQEGQDWEVIEKIEATTYNWDNGQLTKKLLDPKNIFVEKINNNVSIKKITLSDVREGSVIEFNYKISTPYYFHMRDWKFQKKIPVVYSRLNYVAIPYYEYTYLLKGSSKFDEYKSEVKFGEIRFRSLLYQEMEHRFVMKNIPAFKDEEYISSEQDYMINLMFQMSKINLASGGSREIITTWPAMCDAFLKDDDFGKYIKNSEKEAKKILPTLGLEGKTPIEQTEIITEYVKSRYNWNGNNSKYASASVSNFMKQQTGNTADLNLFLIGLLKAAKIDVNPVVLSTRKNGAISKAHPFQQFFNYVIAQVKVDDKVFYIDATEPLLYFRDIPVRCTNVEGLVVKPKTEEWAVIIQKSISFTQQDLHLTILPEENKVKVDAKTTTSGISAYNMRATYLDKDDNLVKYLKTNNNIDVIGNIEVQKTDQLNKPFAFSYSFNTSVDNSSGKLFVHPFCNLSISDNPFKQTSRTLAVDMVYVRGNIYNSTIEIPKGYKVEYLPKSFRSDDELLTLSYEVVSDEGRIKINAGYTMKQYMYEAKDYIALKMTFADMIKRFSEMVVLVKE